MSDRGVKKITIKAFISEEELRAGGKPALCLTAATVAELDAALNECDAWETKEHQELWLQYQDETGRILTGSRYGGRPAIEAKAYLPQAQKSPPESALVPSQL